MTPGVAKESAEGSPEAPREAKRGPKGGPEGSREAKKGARRAPRGSIGCNFASKWADLGAKSGTFRYQIGLNLKNEKPSKTLEKPWFFNAF